MSSTPTGRRGRTTGPRAHDRSLRIPDVGAALQVGTTGICLRGIPRHGMAGCRDPRRDEAGRKGHGDHAVRRGVDVAGNLTRDEARERARLLKVRSYAVALDLTEGEERFESV